MCLVTFMKDVHPDYPLILIANRDELYNRPAAALHRWTDAPTVTAGLDLKEKGTWLGYTNDGKFIAVLNYPFTEWKPKKTTPRSRGQLLRDYLTKDILLDDFDQYLQDSRFDYNGYHLLYGSFNDLRYYSNVDDQFHTFESGIHCLANTKDDLSNHRRDRSTDLLARYVDEHTGELKLEELTALMQDDVKAETLEDYPKELDREMAEQNTSIFIHGDEFGTVGTTAILVDKNNHVHVREVKYDQEGITEVTTKEQHLNLK
ncbi:NRDE family protein [Carnobacteriaceae bacterium 52-44]